MRFLILVQCAQFLLSVTSLSVLKKRYTFSLVFRRCSRCQHQSIVSKLKLGGEVKKCLEFKFDQNIGAKLLILKAEQ